MRNGKIENRKVFVCMPVLTKESRYFHAYDVLKINFTFIWYILLVPTFFHTILQIWNVNPITRVNKHLQGEE